MKKLILISVICVLAWTGTVAQDIDTLPCGQRVRNYYYPHWYDTSDLYLNPDNYYISQNTNRLQANTFAEYPFTIAYQYYTETPVRVRGLWAMVSQDADGHGLYRYVRVLDSTKLPEYLYLYVRNPKIQPDTVTWDTTRWLLPVAHARWDTNQPRMLCLKRFADGRNGNEYCHLFEVVFDSVITIQGEYWIGGTTFSNRKGNGNYLPFPYFPTYYMQMGRRYDPTDPYNHYTTTRLDEGMVGGDPEGAFVPIYYNCCRYNLYPPFGIITDGQHYVQVFSADTAQGTALHTAFYPDSSYQTITAVPAHGYLFSHWNDSVTDNPRSVFVTQDTAFTAFFRPAPLHSVTVRSDNDSLGYTTGDSTFFEGDPAVIKAVPLADNIRFMHWNDGDTVNPRTILVTQDTLFTAYFGVQQSIATPDALPQLFTLTPNPAHGSVTVTLAVQPSNATLTLADASGRELLTLKVTAPTLAIQLAPYPAGTYFLTLRTPDTASTQRLVVK